MNVIYLLSNLISQFSCLIQIHAFTSSCIETLLPNKKASSMNKLVSCVAETSGGKLVIKKLVICDS